MKYCSRCGRCCVFVHVRGEKPKRCKFLIGEIGKKTSCRIYATRLKTEIAPGCCCFPRDLQEKITPMHINECTALEIVESVTKIALATLLA